MQPRVQSPYICRKIKYGSDDTGQYPRLHLAGAMADNADEGIRGDVPGLRKGARLLPRMRAVREMLGLSSV